MFSVHTYSPITSPFSIAVILLLNKIYSIFPFVVLVANIELFSPCLRGIQRHVLVPQYHPSGSNFSLE